MEKSFYNPFQTFSLLSPTEEKNIIIDHFMQDLCLYLSCLGNGIQEKAGFDVKGLIN